MSSNKQADAEKIFKGLIAIFFLFIGISFWITKKRLQDIELAAEQQRPAATTAANGAAGTSPKASPRNAALPQQTPAQTTCPPCEARPSAKRPSGAVSLEVLALKRRISEQAFQSFLQAARVSALSPITLESHSIDQRGPGSLIFEGSSSEGDELTVVVQQGSDEASLRRAFVTERGARETNLRVESRGRPTLYSLTLRDAYFLMRTGRLEASNTTLLIAWKKSHPHTIEEINKF